MPGVPAVRTMAREVFTSQAGTRLNLEVAFAFSFGALASHEPVVILRNRHLDFDLLGHVANVGVIENEPARSTQLRRDDNLAIDFPRNRCVWITITARYASRGTPGSANIPKIHCRAQRPASQHASPS